MAASGYSGKPVYQKLGIKDDMKLLVRNAPSDYEQLLGIRIKDIMTSNDEIADIVHVFVKSNKEFESEMESLLPLFRKNKKLVAWISWYKKSSKIPTDITEDVIRDYALKHGLVDVKVCAVSESWSGLKLVVRVRLR